ncbi:polysaccharide deacetylase family protein [Haloarchaeobius sp. DFWS5]|uniref:polysaccharide deacetylase family protein n=1 Tax=Haloarchaeobius sp. DFWS5 TaxID=3446114 RepID=UPI003EB9CCB9
MVDHSTRRRALKAIGLGTLTGLAGCMGGSDPGTSNPTSATGTQTATSTTGTTAQKGSETTTKDDAQQKDGDVMDDFENLGAWKNKSGKFGKVTGEDAYMGSQSAVMVRTSGEPVIERELEVDLAKSNMSIAIKLEADSHAVCDVTLFNDDDGNSVTFAESIRSSASGYWHRLDLGASNVSGLPDLSKVTHIRITMKGGGSGGKLMLDDLRKVPSPDKGYVALVFDDAQDSDYTKAFQTLKQYDIPATSALVTNHVDGDGFLSMKQIDEMKSAGWEMTSQTANHANLLEAGRLEAEREIVGAKEWLVDHGFKQGAKSFTYPYGLYNEQVNAFVNKHHDMAYGYFSARNATSGYITDPMTISRGDATNNPRAKSMVDLAHLYNEVAVLTFHGIDRGGELDVSSQQFNDFAKYLADSKVETITLSQVADVAQPKGGW